MDIVEFWNNHFNDILIILAIILGAFLVSRKKIPLLVSLI